MTDLVVMAEDAAPVKVNSHQIKLGIRSSFAQGYQTFFEVGNDTGTRVTRHADAVAIGIWPSTGHQVHGFEVKVSRTDFLNEMKDPSKSQAIFRFCHRWSLATPPGLVRVDELPPNWGLVTFDGKSLRTVKAAPLLTPEPLTPGFVAALVRRAGEMDASLISAAVDKQVGDINKQIAERVDAAKRRFHSDAVREVERLKKRVEAFDELFADVPEYELKELAKVVGAVRKSGIASTWQGLRHLIEQLGNTFGMLSNAYEEAGFELPATTLHEEHAAELRKRVRRKS